VWGRRGAQLGLMVEQLRRFAEVKVVATQPALRFVKTLSKDVQAAVGEILGDDAEWRDWKQVRSEGVELRGCSRCGGRG
jgi:hypothetical protein